MPTTSSTSASTSVETSSAAGLEPELRSDFQRESGERLREVPVGRNLPDHALLGHDEGRARVVIERISPAIDGGRFPAKRVRGDILVVSADLLIDGHDKVNGALLVRPGRTRPHEEFPLTFVGNDRWQGMAELPEIGLWQYAVEAWVDGYATWLWGLLRKADAGQDVALELREGAALVLGAAVRANGADAARLRALAADLLGPLPQEARVTLARDPSHVELAQRWPDRAAARRSEWLEVIVDPPRARFSSWYEFFPRSTGAPGRHGTFRDAEARLAYAADMGFDVVYLPPIHPIGHTHRKGPNNTLITNPGDPGSPWAIGGPAGGHTAVHPELGTQADFRRFVERARALGLDVALDIAFQASPDHPYVREHPEWFLSRPDGSVQYAENPPKKYQDVYPFDFSGPSWRTLWHELAGVFFHWIELGVRVFRVDNPHTKPLPFWRWCLATVKAQHPEVVFLSEAFTRPKLMYGLAKAGFSQSYTYFTWRTSKRELTDYLTEITRGEVAEFFRPNLWPNTPDILPEHLQVGTRATFIARLILAGTLSSSYGIYGPAFELQERTPRPGSEEYIDNEKFQLRHWDLEQPGSLRPIIKRLNQIRRESPALQRNEHLHFHGIDNDLLIAYGKRWEDDVILVVVNLDPQHKQSGWLDLDLAALGLGPDESFQVHDLLGDARYVWRGPRAYVELDPAVMPAHVFRLRRKSHSEQTFEYYL